MLKLITTVLLSSVLLCSFGQDRKISVLLNGQFTGTIYDKTMGNNPWAMGIGVQGYLNSKSKFKPTVDITADIYLEDDKVLRENPDGTFPEDLGGVVNLFAGVSYSPKNKIYFSFVLGPGLMAGRTCFGIKPSFGFYFSESKRWTGKISYINIFNRDKESGQDFMSVSFTIGVRLY